MLRSVRVALRALLKRCSSLNEAFGVRIAASRLILVVVLERGFGRRPGLVAHRGVDRLQRQRPVAREVLHPLPVARRVHDRDDVVGADVALDEQPGGRAGPRRPAEPRVEIIDHEDEDAPLERPAVRDHVGRNRGLRVERRIGALDRDVDDRERRERLRGAVLEDLEIVLGQRVYETPLAVGDVRIDLDVVDLDLERDRGLRRRRLLSGRLREQRETESAGWWCAWWLNSWQARRL